MTHFCPVSTIEEGGRIFIQPLSYPLSFVVVKTRLSVSSRKSAVYSCMISSFLLDTCAFFFFVCVSAFFSFSSLLQENELQARDLRTWGPLMHASWSGSAEVFRAVVVSIEDHLGRDQVLTTKRCDVSRNQLLHSTCVVVFEISIQGERSRRLGHNFPCALRRVSTVSL